MYYRGDYYRGDYYRGDPGIFGFLGKAIKTVAGGVFKSTPLGIATSIGKALIPQFGKPSVLPPDYGPPGPGVPPGRVLVGGGVAGIPLRPMIGACPKGHHENKSTYVTRGGGTSRWPIQILVHPKGTECVRIRRMNVANPRALRRSLRRVAGFARIVKRSRRAISRAASAVGIRRGGKKAARAPSVRVVRAA